MTGSDRAEGRSTRFDATAYLAANTDVATATGGDLNEAMRHYALYGRLEGCALAQPATLTAANLTAASGGSLAAAGGL